uniref:Uncharacterized protein n=1 Tax=Oryza brachyantha TaxID=4533 RepID=J3LQS1_ORYBR
MAELLPLYLLLLTLLAVVPFLCLTRSSRRRGSGGSRLPSSPPRTHAVLLRTHDLALRRGPSRRRARPSCGHAGQPRRRVRALQLATGGERSVGSAPSSSSAHAASGRSVPCGRRRPPCRGGVDPATVRRGEPDIENLGVRRGLRCARHHREQVQEPRRVSADDERRMKLLPAKCLPDLFPSLCAAMLLSGMPRWMKQEHQQMMDFIDTIFPEHHEKKAEKGRKDKKRKKGPTKRHISKTSQKEIRPFLTDYMRLKVHISVISFKIRKTNPALSLEIFGGLFPKANKTRNAISYFRPKSPSTSST